MKRFLKTKTEKILAVCTGITVIFGVLQIAYGTPAFLGNLWRGVGQVTLRAAYEGERWYAGSTERLAWLQGPWCFQAPVAGNRWVIRVVEDRVEMLDDGGTVIKTFTPFVSDREFYALRDVEGAWNMTFLRWYEQNPFEFWELPRHIGDDGKPKPSGSGYLALRCDRCTLSRHPSGIDTYECQ